VEGPSSFARLNSRGRLFPRDHCLDRVTQEAALEAVLRDGVFYTSMVPMQAPSVARKPLTTLATLLKCEESWKKE
jgi:hypothetical protein